MTRTLSRILLAALFASLALAPAAAEELIKTKSVEFRQGQSIDLGLQVGKLRVPQLQILPDDAGMLDHLRASPGLEERFSWLRYGLYAENPGDQSWKLEIQVRLLDANGAVVDEFDFDGVVRKGRTRLIDKKRVTLNYAVQYIDDVEITVSARPARTLF
jgi:hypothetical protein